MVFEVFLEVFQMVFKSFLREVKTILKIISENRDIEDYFSSLYFEDLQKMRKFASKYLGREGKSRKKNQTKDAKKTVL